MNWVLFLGIPLLSICIILPIVGIIWMMSNRKNLYDEDFRSKFLILYQGLHENRYYWEFVNVIRKVIILMINVFIPSDKVFLKVATGFSFLVIFLRF